MLNLTVIFAKDEPSHISTRIKDYFHKRRLLDKRIWPVGIFVIWTRSDKSSHNNHRNRTFVLYNYTKLCVIIMQAAHGIIKTFDRVGLKNQDNLSNPFPMQIYWKLYFLNF